LVLDEKAQHIYTLGAPYYKAHFLFKCAYVPKNAVIKGQGA